MNDSGLKIGAKIVVLRADLKPREFVVSSVLSERKRWPVKPESERQRQPWVDLNISRRTYYRWKKKGKV